MVAVDSQRDGLVKFVPGFSPHGLDRTKPGERDRDRYSEKARDGREVHVYRESEREMEWQRYREIERGK